MANIWKNTALVFGSVLVGLALIEIALRLLGLSFPNFDRPDPGLGWVGWPSVSGWQISETANWVSLNRHGFRGPDWTVAHPPGAFRIAVLGDSFVEGMNVPYEDLFLSVMERRLATCAPFAGRKVEVLDFGIQGYGTAQELTMLETRVWRFDPDLVLLAFFNGNDVPNEALALSGYDNTWRRYVVEAADGTLHLDTSFDTPAYRAWAARKRFAQRIVNHVYVLQVLKQIWHGLPAWPYRSRDDDLRYDPAHPAVAAPAPEYPDVFAPPGDETWRDAWRLTEALLRRIDDEVRARGKDFAFFAIPGPIQAFPTAEARAAAARGFGLADLDYTDNRLAAFASGAGIPFLSLAAPLSRVADRERTLLYGFGRTLGDGHLNKRGNQAVGTLVADWLCARETRAKAQ